MKAAARIRFRQLVDVGRVLLDDELEAGLGDVYIEMVTDLLQQYAVDPTDPITAEIILCQSVATSVWMVWRDEQRVRDAYADIDDIRSTMAKRRARLLDVDERSRSKSILMRGVAPTLEVLEKLHTRDRVVERMPDNVVTMRRKVSE